jgi:hypothetical protein
LTGPSITDKILNHANQLEPIHSYSPMPTLQQFRSLPSPGREQDEAFPVATDPGAPLFLHELQQPVLRLPVQKKEGSERVKDFAVTLPRSSLCGTSIMTERFLPLIYSARNTGMRH